MLRTVVMQVTTLAPAPKPANILRHRVVLVQVRRGQHDNAAGDGMGLSVLRPARGVGRATFALPVRPLHHLLAQFAPVRRVVPIIDALSAHTATRPFTASIAAWRTSQ